MNSIDADTVIQLSLIREIDRVFRRAHIRYWLRGGWALDFLRGKITRPHSDIDLVTWKHHALRVRRHLVASGFDLMKNLGEQMDFAKSGQQISIVFIARDQEGRICTPNIPEWEWLPKALSLPPYRLQGISCHVISPEQLLNEKEGYQQGTGQPLRPKDLQSMADPPTTYPMAAGSIAKSGINQYN
jgi:hypothetical protein